MVKLTGTIINYYFHCKRQCWLFSNRINLEDNSEDVRIGKVLHELKSEGKGSREITIDNIKLDKLTDEYVVELKKSDADIEAVQWQVLLYLRKLEEKGLERKGKIEFLEKNKQDKKVHFVELTEEKRQELYWLESEIGDLARGPVPPVPEKAAKCKKCAYYEYCFI